MSSQEQTAGRITEKIAELTGNEATKMFVGMAVVKKKTQTGTVYAIGNTGYVLTAAEFKMFLAAGAIIGVVKSRVKQPAMKGGNASLADNRQQKGLEVLPTKRSQGSAHGETPSNTVQKAAVSRQQARNVASRQLRSTTSAANSVEKQSRPNVMPTSQVRKARQEAEYKKPNTAQSVMEQKEPAASVLPDDYVEESPFLLDYPEPVFDMNAGRANESVFSGIADKFSSFVDSFGKKTSDALVKKMTGSIPPVPEDDLVDVADELE